MSTLLIVDDDVVDRELARRSLRSIDGLAFLEAGDGEEALRVIAEHDLDMVLTDLRMPRMEGLELVRRLREDHPELPVVLMTAQGSERLAVEALEAGAASYVPKAALRDDLAETVSRVLAVVAARRTRGRVLGLVTRTETHMELDTEPSLIPALVAFLLENLERLAFGDPALRNQLGIALIEALSNAMIHGNLELDSELRHQGHATWLEAIARRQSEPPYAGRKVICLARESAAEVEYTIMDEGPGFDVASLPDPTAPENLNRVSGRGILLIRTFMDDVRFEDGGRRIAMRKANPAGARQV